MSAHTGADVVPFYSELPDNRRNCWINGYDKARADVLAAIEAVRHDLLSGNLDGGSGLEPSPGNIIDLIADRLGLGES